MLGWSMNLFRIRGIRLQLHFTFFLLLAYVAYEGWNETHAWSGLLWYLATIVSFFTCIVLHELGHSFTAMHFGIGVRRILLMPIGGMAEFESIPREPRKELLITVAGPAVNFVIAGLCWWFLPALEGQVVEDYSVVAFVWQLLGFNLVMGCFNFFLPAFPMDGGRILRALLATRLPYLRATFWAATVGKIVAGMGVLVALFAYRLDLARLPQDLAELFKSRHDMTAALFTFIIVAGELEYRMVKRRELDDAHWRQVLTRLYVPNPPPSEEPPVLAS